jgi:hypothetical protein
LHQEAEKRREQAEAVRREEKAMRDANVARQHEEKLRKIDAMRTEAQTRHEQAEAVRLEEKALKEANTAREREERLMQDFHEKTDKNLRQLGSNLQHTINWWTTFSAGGGKAAQSTKALSAAVGSFATAAGVIPHMIKWYKSLTLATKGQTTAQILLNTVSGNWFTIAAGLAIAGAVFTWGCHLEETTTEAEKAQEKVENLTDAIKKLNAEAARAGKSVWGFEEMRNVVSAMTQSKNQSLLANVLNRDELKTNLDIAQKDIQNWSQQILKNQQFLAENKRSQTYGGYWYDWSTSSSVIGDGDYEAKMRQIDEAEKRITELQEKIKRAKNVDDKGVTQGLSDLVSSIISTSQTDMDRLQQEMEILKAAIIPDSQGETLIDPELGKQAIDVLNKKFRGSPTPSFRR